MPNPTPDKAGRYRHVLSNPELTAHVWFNTPQPPTLNVPLLKGHPDFSALPNYEKHLYTSPSQW